MPPQMLAHARDLQAACRDARQRGERVALVPTMGALHAGHISLVHEARRRASFVVATIFVNPTQFGPNEDLARYPRDVAGDLAKLATAGVDTVFLPEALELYPEDEETRVRVGRSAEPLCGVSRPGHFEGVTTVVAKLFGIVAPSLAVFGRKDYQQLVVIKRMVRDLFMPVEIVAAPIVREADGLAMSSRNAFLSIPDRARALALVRGLDDAARCFAAGERRPRELERRARAPMDRAADSIDYVELCHPDTLAAFDDEVGPRGVLAAACRIGSTRLIDNIVLGEDPPPLGAP